MLNTHKSGWMTEDVAMFQAAISKFIAAEFVPNDPKWQQQGFVDPEFWRRAGAMGMLCPDVPEIYGGAGGSFAHDAMVFLELGAAGISSFGYAVQTILANYLLAYGTEDQKQRWLPGLVTGDYIAAVAMTEPGGGTDLQSVRTRAVRDGDSYIINGSKTFISNGQIANLIALVVSTDPGKGSRGISIIILEAEGMQGFRRGRRLDKIGQKGQDTSELFFDDCRVPVSNLMGVDENKGFYQLMNELSRERLMVALMGLAAMERALRLTIDYVTERQAFGKHLAEFQNTRFVLAECQTEAKIARVFVDHCVQQMLSGTLDPATASMAKWWVTEKQCTIIDRCLQFFGGYGYMAEYPISKMYADARAQKIYAGTNEIMKELIARHMFEGISHAR